MTAPQPNLTTSERILDIAEELIQRYGYNGFSYDDIARAVGIRKPSIHHHFAAKADLGAAVVKRYTERFGKKLGTIERIQKTSHAQLESYIELFAMTYRQDRRLCLCGMLGAEADTLPEGVRQEIRSFFVMNREWLAQVLQNGRGAGEIFFTEPPERRALTFLSSLEGSMVVGRGLDVEDLVVDVGYAILADLTKS